MRMYDPCLEGFAHHMGKDHMYTIQEHAFRQQNPTNTRFLLSSIVYPVEC